MKRILGGIALLVLALFMLIGFFRSGVQTTLPATIVALLLAVGLPAVLAGKLLFAGSAEKKRIAERKSDLRQRTIEAEVLRLAATRQAKLTIIEVVSELAISPEDAKTALDSLVLKDLADVQVTESGVLVYAFHDLAKLSEKPSAKGILDD